MFKMLDKLAPRCCDCHKRVWPWQPDGIDLASHRKCHWERVRKYRAELEELGDTQEVAFLDAEMDIVRSAMSA